MKSWREEILSTAKFGHTGWTGHSKEPYRHWCYVPAYEGVYKTIFECLNESFKEDGFNLTPKRLLLNVYNHGDSSWLHTDTDSGDNWTTILFMNEYWDVNWHGHFVMVKNNEILKAFSPTPGKFVLFKNSILHGASPVSREAQFPRIALAIQCANNVFNKI
jgi:2OG-Fe(II) oxygenase superfamily